MALLFGNLIQDFVNFQTVLSLAQGGNTTAQALVPQAAADFRNSAGLNASYLVYIGKRLHITVRTYMNSL